MALQLFKIASTTVGSAGAANIEFTSIPQGYTDLKIELSTRIGGAGFANWDAIICYFNSDTTYTNYSWMQLYGNGSTSGSEINSVNNPFISNSTTTSVTANTFSNGYIYIPNYTGSSYKFVSGDSVTENNGTTALTSFNSVKWNNTAAITSIKLQPRSNNFVQYSTATLYGIL